MNKDNYIRLLEKENEVVNETLEHVQADWAESNVVAGTAMLAMATEISRVTEERGRFRGIIRELKKEKYDMGIELEKLKKQNARLTDDLDAADRTIRSLEEKIRKLEDKR